MTGAPSDVQAVSIRDLSARGHGVGSLADGRTVFVPGTIPGETVEVRVEERRASWARGRALAIVDPSPHRREAPCSLVGRCGGCQLQHLAYREQVAWKGRRVAETLVRIGERVVDEPPVEPSSREWGYRNRMSFTLRRLRGGRVVAGLHERDRPGRIVDIHDECLLPEAPVARAWQELRAGWGPGARLLPPGGELRLTLRVAGDGAALVVEGGEPGGDPAALLEAVPTLRSVAHRPGDGSLEHRAGEATVVDRWFGEEIPVASTAFMQVNRDGAEALHLAVLKELGNPAGLRIVDGYCGVGAWGRRLARHGASVTGIELDADAVRAAERDAPAGFTVRSGRVEEVLQDVLPADRLILNPPRTGLHEEVPAILRRTPVPRVVYVSCDPATLARDLKRLGEGWTVRAVRAFDLFPQTAHVETMAVLEPAGPHLTSNDPTH